MISMNIFFLTEFSPNQRNFFLNLSILSSYSNLCFFFYGWHNANKCIDKEKFIYKTLIIKIPPLQLELVQRIIFIAVSLIKLCTSFSSLAKGPRLPQLKLCSNVPFLMAIDYSILEPKFENTTIIPHSNILMC